MRVAAAIVTRGGGTASHAAIVARQWGVPAVCGIGALEVAAGAQLMVDGATGEVRLLDAAKEAVPGVGAPSHQGPLQDLPGAVATLLRWADDVARTKLHVLANADTAADAALARDLGAAGVGLCRTEHQFMGERSALMERILSGDQAAIAEMASLQRTDIFEVLQSVEQGPTIIRLLDAPRHEFDPSHAEHNPMLGLRGIRMAVRHPEILVAQAEAIAHAAADHHELRQALPDVRVMLPMVAIVEELTWARTLLDDVFFRVGIERGIDLSIRIGTMIETPRAALVAASLAAHCDFFSFGTNDLTQLTWGYSRDDLDAELVPLYRERGLLDRSPFEALDGSGVVRLMALAAETGRSRNPELGLGMCGEHGGDPASIAVAVQLGLTTVSVSPYRVPAARLAAAHAVLGPAPSGGSA